MIEELLYDADGTSRWIEREADLLPEFHYARELVVNAWDAGATRVTIDGWTDAHGHHLTRFSDNGSGMTLDELVAHGRTLHLSGRGRADNYGVGGRLATLTTNPAGVTWASYARCDHDVNVVDEAMIQLIRERGRYGLRIWEIEEGLANAISPDGGELDRLAEGETGTAVILHGDGHSSTYTGDEQAGIDRYLTRRFMWFKKPVYRVLPNSTQSHRLVPYGERLLADAETSGQVIVDDQGSIAHWWILPPVAERKRESSHTIAAIGARYGDELFDLTFAGQTRARYPRFGITPKGVRNRVTIIVASAINAQMSTNRARLELPGGGDLPWDEWGTRFYEQMPAAITALIDIDIERAHLWDEFIDNLMTPDWFRFVNATPTLSERPHGDISIEATSAHATSEPSGKSETKQGVDSAAGKEQPPRRTRIGERAGQETATERKSQQPPRLVIVEQDDWNEEPQYWAVYYKPTNEVWLRSDAIQIQMSVGRAATKFPQYPRALVERAVLNAYGAEAAMKAVHLLSQAKHGWAPHVIDAQLEAPGLSASLLGLNAVEFFIETALRRESRR